MEINKLLTKVNRTLMKNKVNKYIVIHYVGKVSSAKNNAYNFENVNRGGSANYFVDPNEIWQVVDDSNAAWHCEGARTYYNDCRNGNSIGIEMCCKKSNLWYFEEDTVKNTIWLVKMLMKKYNIPIENVIRHYDVTHKVCPEPYVRDIEAWNNFKKECNVMEFTDAQEAFNFLVDKKIIEDRVYWAWVLTSLKNFNWFVIKVANHIARCCR